MSRSDGGNLENFEHTSENNPELHKGTLLLQPNPTLQRPAFMQGSFKYPKIWTPYYYR